MGKANGFMEYERMEMPSHDALQRINDFNEFHDPLDQEQRRQQGARCMNCGVPLCQSAMELGGMVSGCPLHNLIPEWNDEVYHGHMRHALSRLLKTNPFPEFTGRVCPALCEKACICGMNAEPVTIRENELYIIEDAFAKGRMKPEKKKSRNGKKIAVIGSGPSGLAAAYELNRRGHEVHVYERDERGGGLLMYGIPNMKLDKNIVERRIDLMKEEGIVFHFHQDIGKNVSVQTIDQNYDAAVFCCGSKTARDLSAEGRASRGIHFAVDYLSQATRAWLKQEEVKEETMNAKGKKVVVIGGGDTGNDCVATCIRQGCTSVVQLEMMPQPPLERLSSNPWPQWPRVCKTDYGQQEAIAVFQKDPRLYQTTVKRFLADDHQSVKGVETIRLSFENGRMQEIAGSEEVLEADLVLIAAGFVGCESYISDAFQLPLTSRHTIRTKADSYRIADSKYFAAGDVRRGQSLVVWAIAEGRACAREVDRYLMGYTEMNPL